MIILSLFDGKSSGYTACELAGIPVTRYYSSEVDKYAIKVSDSIHPLQIRLGDVTRWREWDIPWWDIDLIIAGSPCQGFSFSGKQLAFDDPRSKLFFEFVDILNHVKFFNSKVKFMLENVKMKRDHLDVITGYLGVEPHFINSSLVSAQNRQRYYWCNWSVPQPEDRKIFMRDVLEYDVPESFYHTPKAIEYMNREVKGGRTHWDFSHHCDSSHDKSVCLTANIHKGVPYNVLVDRDKSYSLTASYANGVDPKQYFEQKRKQLVFKGDRYRKLTPRECYRLQTVPEHYIDKILACGVSNTQLYKIAGNGWNDETIAHIFRYMR